MGSVQDNEKKRLRYFRERFEEKRKGQQAGCISQERLGNFPKEKLCFEVVVIYCCVGGRTVQIRTIRTIGTRARFSSLFLGTKFDVVLRIPCYRKGSYRSGCTTY